MTKRSSNSRIWNEARTRMAISLSAMAVALQLLDLLADGAGFLLGVPGAGDGDLLAQHVVGAQRLAEPAFVVGDQMRGGGEDVAGGAVIALEPDHGGAGKIVLEAQDVVDLGAAPAVDRLVVVADAADVFGCRGARGRRSLSRRLRGEDWGEGGLRWLRQRKRPLIPALRSTSPRARGEVMACSSAAPTAAATDTARRWCPDIRRPG